MKKLLVYFLLLLVSFTVFVACQKELSFEQPGPAVAALRKDSSGNCIPSVAVGTFVAGRALTDSNAIQVEVAVSQTGSYSIQTTEVNGYSFKGTGTFTSTGVTLVRLTGSGTPAAEGINNFTVLYGDSSFCTVQVLVLPAGSGGPAAFTLGATPGTCPTVDVAGTYSPGNPLAAEHSIDFQVNVTAIGTYALATDTVNGFYFSGSGALLTTGVQTITLMGTGTPLAADSTTFRLRSGSTVCTFKVGVTGTVPPPPSGPCVIDSIKGTYVAGTPLNGTHKVYLKHTYMAPGTFTVTTNTVNGFLFKDTVTVATGGTVTSIELNGSGTPGAAGVSAFVISFGDNATCTFNVTVTNTTPPPPPPPSGGTYFPLTRTSYWTYGEVNSGDTLKRVVADSVIRDGRQYRLFVETDMDGDTTHYFFQRNGNDYNEYAYVDNYSLILFAEEIYGDILFLKENVTAGQTWTSAEWTGTDTDDDVVKKLRYVFSCTAVNTTATINGVAYTNVNKISFKSQTAPNGSSTWTDEGVVWDAWYAKGIGMVTLKANLTGFPAPVFDLGIRRYQVQ